MSSRQQQHASCRSWLSQEIQVPSARLTVRDHRWCYRPLVSRLSPAACAGMSGFYLPFMRALHEGLGGTATLSAITHVGLGGLTEGQLFDLEDQVEHKRQWFEQHLMRPGSPPCALIGHSIGESLAVGNLRRTTCVCVTTKSAEAPTCGVSQAHTWRCVPQGRLSRASQRLAPLPVIASSRCSSRWVMHTDVSYGISALPCADSGPQAMTPYAGSQVIGLFPFLAGSPTHKEQQRLTFLTRWPFVMALISALVGMLPRKLTKAVVTSWAGACCFGRVVPDAAARAAIFMQMLTNRLSLLAGSVDEHAMDAALVRSSA